LPHLTHPYQSLTHGAWLRGNLHTHTTRSDGSRPQQPVIDSYRERGYDYLMLSDHDIFTSASELSELAAGDMVLIPGNEVTAKGVHILHVGADRKIEPTEDRQIVFDSVAATTGSAIVNHPNWQQAFDHCPIASLKAWNGYIGIEIFNGVIGFLEGSPYATNKWDILLSSGRRVWGFANDDSHAEGHDGLGWNVTYAQDRTPDAIVEALAAGCFYPSTGVVIESIDVDGLTVQIKTKNAQRINALVDHGRRIKTVDDNAIEVTAPQNAKYLRFECWGAGESFAWTQPFFIEANGE